MVLSVAIDYGGRSGQGPTLSAALEDSRCSLEREAQSTHSEGMGADVAVVAGMLPGRGSNDHIESRYRLGNRRPWVTAQSRALDWMKRID